jgi:hypothetical protein
VFVSPPQTIMTLATKAQAWPILGTGGEPDVCIRLVEYAEVERT